MHHVYGYYEFILIYSSEEQKKKTKPNNKQQTANMENTMLNISRQTIIYIRKEK